MSKGKSKFVSVIILIVLGTVWYFLNERNEKAWYNAPEPPRPVKTLSEVSKDLQEKIKTLEKTGLLTKFDIDMNEAYVNQAIWDKITLDTKKGVAVTLAKVCDEAGSSGRIVIINYLSGKKLAKYSSWGFKVWS